MHRSILILSLALLLLPALAGCPPVRGDDDDACGGNNGTLSVCATLDEAPAAGGSLEVETDPDSETISTPLDADGCAQMDVAAGTVQWRALNSWGDCISQWTDADVEACVITEATVDLGMWCFDGLAR